ncbi:hypothetical protein EJ03DRAFT_388703 [Teratosphaeria nubilosa]|uniref:Phosphoglycerate mutase-like protein n=1 Tax=Teratosphaeria nubilosa TaxID=161662 RepID=A0A6G1LCK8_9PEZI|nr:hypothetical protein EJ03DRAFT_388703 [Teratosphaeria nubilosa]
MAPNSRIILTRHAEAEHDVDLDYSIPDAPLTPLGKKQAATLAPQIPQLQNEADLIRLGIENVICLPQVQECNDLPCDTGSPREVLEADPEGFWAADPQAIANRARWVRQWLRERPEKTIVLVAHGDIPRNITAGPNGPSTYPWKNAEARI